MFEKKPLETQSFPAAFMLRDERFLSAPEQEREAHSVSMTSEFIFLTSPAYLSIIELHDDREREFVERIYREYRHFQRNSMAQVHGTWNFIANSI